MISDIIKQIIKDDIKENKIDINQNISMDDYVKEVYQEYEKNVIKKDIDH